MSAAKKRRELNRAIEEHDRHRLSAEFATSKHTMMNIAESVLGQQIKTQADRIEELEAENAKLKEECLELRDEIAALKAERDAALVEFNQCSSVLDDTERYVESLESEIAIATIRTTLGETE